ncbi:DUF2188 domain-containing protein [Filobacillus milosensis]|uniref:DUF2188 domain-containing protein n=1 Tax=Filobacillus milosensis TaxID=94137 RepID=A0A4Y8IU50_9BACI|nr:DUF2188 domain-containing protein [Filobacillus milosensis]TFB24456.1 DUF2188 domain-containing protein [Filobacillus milosensis]
MPFDRTDYPSSLKNLNEATRLKAIEIMNAMLDEGYDEDEAIPIATEQAKEWYANANGQERQEMRDKSAKELKKHDDHNSRPELMDKGVKVFKQKDEWAVKTKTAKRPSDLYNKKDDAIERGKEIAKNKETYLEVYDQDGNVQDKFDYSN